ncbi:hypothetical protein ACQ4PT_063520 [Festuca glaucescens]
MVSGTYLVRAPGLLQPVLRLPSEPSLHILPLGADRGPADRQADGRMPPSQGRRDQGHPLVLLSQPRAVQPQGARPHHYLCQQRLQLCLRRRRYHHRQGLLPPGHPPARRHAPHSNHPADGVWLGWSLQEVPCGLPLHVVAVELGTGLALQGAAREGEEAQGREHEATVLPRRPGRQLRLLHRSQLPLPDHLQHFRCLPGVEEFRDGAADRLWRARARRRVVWPRLGHGGRLPGHAAVHAGVRHHERDGGVLFGGVRALARGILEQRVRRQALPHHLLQRVHGQRQPVRCEPGARPGHLQVQPVRVRRRRADQLEHLLRLQLRPQLRRVGRYSVPRRPLPRQIHMAADEGDGERAADRRTHEADEEELHGGATVVVPCDAGSGARPLYIRLRGVWPGAAAPLLGRAPGGRASVLLHTPHRHHHRHHQSATSECGDRADHRVPVPREATGERGVQDVRLHQHVPGHHVPHGLQAGPLHEDPAAVHVRCPARGDRAGLVGLLRHVLVAAGERGQHLRPSEAAGGEPVDVPQRRSLLQRVRHLGRGWPAAHLRAPRPLRQDELLLPRRRAGAGAHVGAVPGLPGKGVDPAHQHARAAERHRGDAVGAVRELPHVGCRWAHLQPRRLPAVQGMVGAAQLRAIGSTGRRRGVHGHRILRHAAVERRQRCELVGAAGR